MAAGKNKLQRFMRLYCGGYDLSGDARVLSSLDNKFAWVDLTGWSDAIRAGLADGQRQVGVRGFQALLNDAAAGAFTALKNADNTQIVSVALGSGTEPAVSDPAYLLASAQISDNAGWDGRAAAINADFVPDAAQANANAVRPWGKVLLPLTALAATTNGTAINNGAASTAGAHAQLHVLATAAGNFAFTLEHSTTGAFAGEEATLMTFTANGSAITAERQVAAGTVNQYVRFRAVRTGGTCSVVCTFARN